MSAPFRMPAPIDTGEAARYLHARRALEQAIDHGTALLAALGLPRLVDDGVAPTDREAAGEALTAAVALLDAIDPDPDLEPSLGAPEQQEWISRCVGGRWFSVPADQRHWADGNSHDREQEITDEAHDGEGDEEPSLGWPEDITAKVDDVLQADHDLELDDGDLEDGDDDDDGRWPWPDGAPDELIGVHAHV